MAEIDNLNEINENFDTIKTLLNSIRAQGILNTSDVDKLLSGINSKLERINTEEDIDLIKVFLTELKQNLDERHNVLVSKFGAIEALFSNLLKNSNELPKSSELKELFDVVATNLSVFSREVVAQKESLTDIAMKLDSIRSDDSQKKDIIKNITLLKPDLERLNNGFDTIVLSLNDNFKTLAKTISTIDKTEHLDKFADSLNNIEISSNALLSAIQLLDKKNEGLDDSIKGLATKGDVEQTDRKIAELKLLNQSINESVNEINDRHTKLDTLAEKIDASVNIIAGLKAGLEDIQSEDTKAIIEKLDVLEKKLSEIQDDTEFDEFKTSLSAVLSNITDNTSLLDKNLVDASDRINSVLETIKELDIKNRFDSLISTIDTKESGLKEHIENNIEKVKGLGEANLNKIISNITSSTDSLNTRLNQTQSELSSICESSFGTVFENIAELKKVVSQIDENGVSANNAMFSNISDRLNLFEASLKESLEIQESTTSEASARLNEQVENIKNLSNVMDYKMDSSVVEISNMTRMFETLKESVNSILALNFVDVVKDLRADIYAAKQDIDTVLESSFGEVSENIAKDMYGKYELIISKLDSIEEEFKKTQMSALSYTKEVMEKISDSLVDILSYVSEAKEFPTEEIEHKISGLTNTIKETHLNYVENVRDIVDSIRVQLEANLKLIEEESAEKIDKVNKSVERNAESIKNDIKNSYDKLLEIKSEYESLRELININSVDHSDKYDKLYDTANEISSGFDVKLTGLKTALLDKISEFKNEFTSDNADKINEFKFSVENLYNKYVQEIFKSVDDIKLQLDNISTENNESRTTALDTLLGDLTELKELIGKYSAENSAMRSNAFDKLSENMSELRVLVQNASADNTEVRSKALDNIYSNFDSINKSVKDIAYDLSEGRKSGLNIITESINDLKEQLASVSENDNSVISKITESCEEIKSKIEKFSDDTMNARTNVFAQILDNFVGLKDYAKTLSNSAAENLTQKSNMIIESFESVKSMLRRIDEDIDGDLTRQFSIIESNFESLISQITILNDKSEQSLIDKINYEYQNISEQIDRSVTQKLEDYKSKIEETFDSLSQRAHSESSYLQERVADINSAMKTVWAEQAEANAKQIDEISDRLKAILDENIELTAVDYNNLRERLDSFTRDLESNNEFLTQNLKAQLDDMTKYVDSVLDIQVQETGARADELIQSLEKLSEKLFANSDAISAVAQEQLDVTNSVRAEISSVGSAVESSTNVLENLSSKLDEKSQAVFNILNENSAKEIRTMEETADKLLEQIELGKHSIESVKEFIAEITQNRLNSVVENIEKETDAIISEVVEQFDLMKKSQQDYVIQITTGIESVIANQIYTNIEDLKSYLDVRTDTSIITDKLDNLKIEMASTLDNVITDLNKMLSADVFTSALSDYRVANEILVNSAADRLNEKIGTFIGDFSTKVSSMIEDGNLNIENKLALFDKKFVDTVVDKYEEIKLISNKYNSAFDSIQTSVNDILSDFQGVKSDFETRIEKLIEKMEQSANNTNLEIRQLSDCLESLRSQISNKSFDEAFQASINKQIASLEGLIKEQLSYIEDINELCGVNLPDVSELNTLVKGVVIEKLNNLTKEFEAQDVEGVIETALRDTKSDIITQFLNIFNQISFVAEQEEILDFIQEKHDELIKVLSHIVTNSSVKNDVVAVDSKINSLRDEISIINNKISNIISSEGDIDYIYSLQDLESDIANLRIVLKEMKDNTDNYGTEFDNLMSSTEGVYKLVESIKEDLPDKKSFESMSEDIVSISTRTNKLILASDESYKTLKDNLHDFKLVINDLDERTRNFAQESGMDRIDSKLNALNSMVQNGAKTNQVFNQVFEYLAEWIDNASTQINEISDKVETLDEIGQIKVMLADLKAEAEDNSENVELIEALGNVFDKQAKKISTLETKLDKMIVEATINNKNNKIDIKPMEDTLNKFLAAIGEKLTSQQEKIDSLEASLEKIVDILDEKDTAQLTKKVGGMDRQIAKLNKSIEKIASHVVEK